MTGHLTHPLADKRVWGMPAHDAALAVQCRARFPHQSHKAPPGMPATRQSALAGQDCRSALLPLSSKHKDLVCVKIKHIF